MDRSRDSSESENNESYPLHRWTRRLAILTTVILLICDFAPIWIWLSDSEDHLGVSLFYRIGWKNDGIRTSLHTFNTIVFEPEDTIWTPHWYTMMFFMFLATVGQLFVIALVHFHKMRVMIHDKTHRMYVAIVLASVTACVSCLIVLILFAVYHHDAITDSLSVCKHCFSWGWMLTMVAFIISFVITVIIAVKFTNSSFHDGQQFGKRPGAGFYQDTSRERMEDSFFGNNNNKFQQGTSYANDIYGVDDVRGGGGNPVGGIWGSFPQIQSAYRVNTIDPPATREMDEAGGSNPVGNLGKIQNYRSTPGRLDALMNDEEVSARFPGRWQQQQPTTPFGHDYNGAAGRGGYTNNAWVDDNGDGGVNGNDGYGYAPSIIPRVNLKRGGSQVY